MVRIYSRIGGLPERWALEGTCTFEEFFESNEELTDGDADELITYGELLIGGGAAPLFKVVLE